MYCFCINCCPFSFVGNNLECDRAFKAKAHAESDSSLSKEPHPSGSSPPDELNNLLQAMEELDAPQNTPKCLSPVIWERFCQFRRTKVESEHKVTRI